MEIIHLDMILSIVLLEFCVIIGTVRYMHISMKCNKYFSLLVDLLVHIILHLK